MNDTEIKVITQEIYQATSGEKFIDKEAALSRQKQINNTVYFLVKTHFGVPAVLNEFVIKYMKRLNLKNNYVGIISRMSNDPELMLEEYLYEKYGNSIGQSRTGRRLRKWTYEKVDHETVFSDPKGRVEEADDSKIHVLRQKRLDEERMRTYY